MIPSLITYAVGAGSFLLAAFVFLLFGLDGNFKPVKLGQGWRRLAARCTLAAPIWPIVVVAAIVWGVRKGVPAIVRTADLPRLR